MAAVAEASIEGPSCCCELHSRVLSPAVGGTLVLAAEGVTSAKHESTND